MPEAVNERIQTQKFKSHISAQRNISKRWQLDLAAQNDVTEFQEFQG